MIIRVVIVHTKTIRERVEDKHQELIENYHAKKEEQEKNRACNPRSP